MLPGCAITVSFEFTTVIGPMEPGDLVLTMGAGDITALGPRLVEILRGSPE